MSTSMIPCPHCGAENSARKRVCYHCQQELVSEAAAAPAVPAQPKTPKPAPSARPQPVSTRDQARRMSVLFAPTLAQRAQFYRQMQHLLQSGIPLVLSLTHLEEQIPSGLRPMVRDMSARVQTGETLSSTMADYPAVFLEWEISLMRASELTGNLYEAAGEVATTLEMEHDLQRRTNSATIYLRAVVVVGILVALILMNLQGAQGMAAALAAVERAFTQFIYVLAFIVLVWQAWRLWTRTRTGMQVNAAILAGLPLVGPLIRNLMRTRFARVLGALWGAGVSPSEALVSAARASGNGTLVRQIEARVDRVARGAPMSEIVEETGIFPPEMLYLLRTGESSGSVAAALAKIAQYLELEVETRAKALPGQLYLAFFFIIAIAVGYFVIRFYAGMMGNALELMGE